MGGKKTIPERNEACRLDNTIDIFFQIIFQGESVGESEDNKNKFNIMMGKGEPIIFDMGPVAEFSNVFLFE